MGLSYIKSKQFLLTWLAVYLIIPTFWLHQVFMTYEAEGTVFLFAGSRFAFQFLDQLFLGDFGDAFIILGLIVLPLVVYAFIISLFLHFVFLKMKRKSNVG